MLIMSCTTITHLCHTHTHIQGKWTVGKEGHERVKAQCLWVVIMRDLFTMFFINFWNSLQRKWVAFIKLTYSPRKHILSLLEIKMELFTEQEHYIPRALQK